MEGSRESALRVDRRHFDIEVKDAAAATAVITRQAWNVEGWQAWNVEGFDTRNEVKVITPRPAEQVQWITGVVDATFKAPLRQLMSVPSSIDGLR